MFKEKQITVVIKEPGKEPRIEPLFDNTLKAFQTAVDGYIETVSILEDLVIICNEEGRLKGLEPNVTILSVDFVGTVIAVGGLRNGEFRSLKGEALTIALDFLKEVKP